MLHYTHLYMILYRQLRCTDTSMYCFKHVIIYRLTLPTGNDVIRVEVIQDTQGWATIYWWEQSDGDKQVDIIVTNVTTGTQSQCQSQPDVTLFYLPERLTNGDHYTVTVRGVTSRREGEVSFRAGNGHLNYILLYRTWSH